MTFLVDSCPLPTPACLIQGMISAIYIYIYIFFLENTQSIQAQNQNLNLRSFIHFLKNQTQLQTTKQHKKTEHKKKPPTNSDGKNHEQTQKVKPKLDNLQKN